MPSLNAWLIGLALFVLSNVGSYFYGMNVQKDIQTGKQATTVITGLKDTVETVSNHSKDIVKGVNQDNEIERKANEAYEKASAELRKARDENKSLIRQLGGLRIPASVCTLSSTIDGETKTAGTGQRYDYLAGTIALPQQIDQDLQDSADESDEYIERFRILQNWVREQGFYGPSEIKDKPQ